VSILVVTGERGSRTISAQMTDRPAETLLALLSKAAIRRCFARCADEPIGEESKPRRRDILSARSGAVTPSYTSVIPVVRQLHQSARLEPKHKFDLAQFGANPRS
jgi:hypothetical protein